MATAQDVDNGLEEEEEESVLQDLLLLPFPSIPFKCTLRPIPLLYSQAVSICLFVTSVCLLSLAECLSSVSLPKHHKHVHIEAPLNGKGIR